MHPGSMQPGPEGSITDTAQPLRSPTSNRLGLSFRKSAGKAVNCEVSRVPNVAAWGHGPGCPSAIAGRDWPSHKHAPSNHAPRVAAGKALEPELGSKLSTEARSVHVTSAQEFRSRILSGKACTRGWRWPHRHPWSRSSWFRRPEAHPQPCLGPLPSAPSPSAALLASGHDSRPCPTPRVGA